MSKNERRPPDPDQEGAGEKEKADREWLDGYSNSWNPMEGPLDGLARMVKARPGIVVFALFCILVLVLVAFFYPS